MTLEELSKDKQWQADEQTGKELIPCKICGGKAEICMRYARPANRYRVRCLKCKLSTPYHLNLERAIDYWNKSGQALDWSDV